MSKSTIVLAGVRDAYRVKPGTCARIDLGERHQMETYLEPVSIFWLNEGTAEDIDKARAYVESNRQSLMEGAHPASWAVYVYPTEYADPIGAARATALQINTPAATPIVEPYRTPNKPAKSRSKRSDIERAARVRQRGY